MKNNLCYIFSFLPFNPVKIIAKQSYFMSAISYDPLFSTTADCICPSFTLNIEVPLMQLWLHSPVLQFLSKPSVSYGTKIRRVTHL